MEYAQTVRNNILPLSVGDTLPKAFEEWSFTEIVKDHGAPTETCELCGQKELRYHYLIQNSLTGHSLWVGSHCILKFGLSVFENGRKLTPEQAKKKLDRLAQQMRLDSCIKALSIAAEKENSELLRNAIKFYQKNKWLTPKFGQVVLWRLKKDDVDHSPSFFKITLKRSVDKDQIREMEEFKLRSLWPALTSSQKSAVRKMRESV